MGSPTQVLAPGLAGGRSAPREHVDPERHSLAEAERALEQRPRLSLTLRIGASMLLCFLLVAAVVVTSMVLMSEVGKQEEVLERAATYSLEVEHARRFEKNYLLYGSGLDDALGQVQKAHQQLVSLHGALVEIVGESTVARMEEHLETYGQQLERLGTRREPATAEERETVQHELRRSGAQVLADAADLIDRERLRLRTAIRASSLVGGGSLLVILLVMAGITWVLTLQVARPMRRFVEYTQRIAAGDFSPIQPARRYRDEFSRLAVAINRMVFRLKDRELQLARTSRMAAVGTLTAGIAHELNNPLNNIGLNAEALYASPGVYTEVQRHKMLGDILGQVERASATVRNLLDFTRVEKPTVVVLSVADVVREAARLCANEAQLAHVDLQLEVPVDLPRLEGSPRDLQQVVLNLLLNAIQAMPGGGSALVRGEAAGGVLRLEVSDTGVGIPEEHLSSIFDPFFTTKRVGEGTGLGLFVTYGIVEKHRGRIEVRSEMGVGTTFTVELPLPGSPGLGHPAER